MHKSVANVDAPCLYPNSHVQIDVVVVVDVADVVVVLVTVLVVVLVTDVVVVLVTDVVVEDVADVVVVLVTVLVVEDVTDVVVDVVGKCVQGVQSGLHASRFDLSTVSVP
jgi:hypothetical protein